MLGQWELKVEQSGSTLSRRQLKMPSSIDKRGSKIDRNSVFDCHLSPVWPQMAIKNTVSIDFSSTFLDSIGVYPVWADSSVI